MELITSNALGASGALDLSDSCHSTSKPLGSAIIGSPKAITCRALINPDRFSATVVPAASMMITTSNAFSCKSSTGSSYGLEAT